MKNLFYGMKIKFKFCIEIEVKSITSFNSSMPGCPDIKIIVESDVKTPISLSYREIVVHLGIYIVILIKIEK